MFDKAISKALESLKDAPEVMEALKAAQCSQELLNSIERHLDRQTVILEGILRELKEKP